MSGMLLTALQFYTRTRAQRWLFAGALALWTAQLLVTRAACAWPCSFTLWPFILGGLTAAAAAVMLIAGAWDFRRISALRTVYLIPYSRLKLVGGMLLAQLFAALIVSGLVMLVGEARALPPLAWGSGRGTFEMLFGCALFCIVLVQVITGPSRVLSVASLALVTPLVLRPDLFMKPDLIGLPKAHVLASAGILVWLLFAAWYVSAWRPAVPLSVWSRGGPTAAARVSVSRKTAIETFLLGQPSLLRVCRQQLLLWVLCHFSTIAMLAVTSLLIDRHHLPVDYATAITILLYGPVVGVNTVAGCVARGSRRLWLRSGETRTMLYSIAARLAWHALALLGIPLFGLAIVEMRFLPHTEIDLWFPLAICVTLTPCALYLGLLNFQRRLNLSFLALYVVAGSAPVASLWVESAQGRKVLWIAPVVLLAIGGVLRNLARRRWCGIDWLRFRAERETSSFAVRRG